MAERISAALHAIGDKQNHKVSLEPNGVARRTQFAGLVLAVLDKATDKFYEQRAQRRVLELATARRRALHPTQCASLCAWFSARNHQYQRHAQ